jgi:pre-mRNA cleavage complex 2 protein Pcf11
LISIIVFTSRRQPGVVALLYSGIQCSSCGVRFPPEQTMKYSQHLDWHFRQNRRDRDNTRKAQSRKWYYDVSDWIQFEEIEDLEERGRLCWRCSVLLLCNVLEDGIKVARS